MLGVFCLALSAGAGITPITEGHACGMGVLSGLFDPDPTFQPSACLFPQHSQESRGLSGHMGFLIQ